MHSDIQTANEYSTYFNSNQRRTSTLTFDKVNLESVIQIRPVDRMNH